MDTNVIIANQIANWGQSQSRIRHVLAFLSEHKFPFSLFTTERAGHARELAINATAQNAKTIIVLGGDGTVNEAINGILNTSCERVPVVGIIPLGSSNDFSKSLAIPQRLRQACEAIINGKTRYIDVGQAGAHYFCMASCIGLFSKIALQSSRLKGMKGSLRYMAAALKVIRQMPPGWEMKIKTETETFEGIYGNLLVSNVPRFGGLTMIAGAQPDDGILDCMLIEMPDKRQALNLAVLAARRGLEHHKNVTLFKAKSLSISLDRPALLCNDGEVHTDPVKEIEYRVLPGKLQIIC
ncbi:MAG: diacylglycerol/lipid kinase family protein [Planctomycetota bacterium]